MKTCLLAAVLFLLPQLCADSVMREAWSSAAFIANASSPEFRHGHLVQREPDSGPATGFTVYSVDGKGSRTHDVELPGASHTSMADVDLDSDGTAAAAVAGLGNLGYLQGISLMDSSGHLTRFIDTGRYVPGHIAFGPDHTIWAMGWQRDSIDSTREDRKDYTIIRQFSAEGKEIKAFLARSLIGPGLEPGSSGGDLRIIVTPNRIGVLVYSGQTGDKREWLEMDWHGNLIVRVRIDNLVRAPASVAFTSDDRIYLQGAGFGELHTLDLSLTSWVSVPNQGAFLMGADDNLLVYGGACCGPVHLQWFQQPQVTIR